MRTSSARLNLLGITNWPKLAADAHYQASELAKNLKVGPRQLQREFRRQLNTTPQKYLDKVRLTEARELAYKRMRTKEISNQLEFKHASQLCRQFHALFGVALGAFRQSAKGHLIILDEKILSHTGPVTSAPRSRRPM